MATIVTRKGAAGPSFQARLRLTRDGELIHKESKTFSTKAAAKTWAQKREVELSEPKAMAVAIASGTCTLATLIRWYISGIPTHEVPSAEAFLLPSAADAAWELSSALRGEGIASATFLMLAVIGGPGAKCNGLCVAN